MEQSMVKTPQSDSSVCAQRWMLTQGYPHITAALFGLQVCIEPWIFVNVYVDGTKLPTDEQQKLLERPDVTIQSVLEACRSQFAASIPRFCHVIWAEINSAHQLTIEERLVPGIVEQLPSARQIFPATSGHSEIPIVGLNSLKTQNCTGHFFPAGVRKVQHDGRDYAAKGPIYASQVKDFVGELKSIVGLSFLKHPHIIASPKALISMSLQDERICGFLMPFYDNGNLDTYSQKRFAAGTMVLADILKWLRQLGDALVFLRDQGTWHGDIKPDNLLVTSNGDVQLTDFTKTAGTSVTASPEVREHCRGRTDPTSVMLGVPLEWPVWQIASSEVYSVGRTLYLVMTGQSMVKIYRKYGWVSDDPFLTNFDEDHDCYSEDPKSLIAVDAVKDIILRCVQVSPSQRIGLETLLETVESLEQQWSSLTIKIAVGPSTTREMPTP